MMASAGETPARSSIKSLRWESPSSPIGVSSEIGYLHDLEHPAHLGLGNVHALGNLCRPGFAAQLLDQLPRDANQFVDDLDHVHREADGARLVGNGAADCLANPPRGISGELVAAAVLELVHRLHEADVALLNQVEELQPAIGILFGDGNHEAQVGLDELMLGLLRVHLGAGSFRAASGAAP